MIPLAMQEAAYRVGVPALDLVHAMNAPAVGPLHAPPLRRRRGGRYFSLAPHQVADLVRRFADRQSRVDPWVKREARALGVSPATVRRAVYAFGSYAAEGGAR